jgi:Nuclease-related domain
VASSVPIWGLVASRKLELRREDVCARCGAPVPAGTQAWWDRETRTVICTECGTSGGSSSPPIPAPLKRGQPGGSLLREHERRQRNRENRARKAHPRVGGVLLALGSAPPHESVFAQGAAAERAVADSLARRTTSDSVITLHNHRMPNGRGDIDHIAIAASGVWVIDTKDWAGKVEIESPWSGTPRLRIRGRDRTRLIDGLERQITAVRAVRDRGGYERIAVQGALCFTKADLPWLRTQTFRGHLLLHRRALAKRLTAAGPLAPASIEEVARHLATSLPRGALTEGEPDARPWGATERRRARRRTEVPSQGAIPRPRPLVGTGALPLSMECGSAPPTPPRKSLLPAPRRRAFPCQCCSRRVVDCCGVVSRHIGAVRALRPACSA